MEFLKNKKKLLILIPIFVFLDQLTKQWALKNIFDNQKIIEINQYLNFTPVWNRGISFGMFSNVEGINFYMIILTLIIILILFLWFFKREGGSLNSWVHDLQTGVRIFLN